MFSNCGGNRQFNVHTCRACLGTTKDDYVSLKHNSDMSQVYEFCVGISVKPNDVLQAICVECVKVLKEFANFKKLCHASNEQCKSSFTQESTIYTEKVTMITEIKIEHNDNSSAFNTLNLSQDEHSSDILQDNIHNYHSKDTEYKLEPSSSVRKRKKKSVQDPYEDNKNTHENLHKTYKKESDDINSENENCGNEGLIKVLECSKCKKQYQKTKCLIKHMTQLCYKHVNVNKLVIVKKYRPASSKVKDASNELFCGICNFSSSGRNDLKQHLGEHWDNNDMQCKLCGFIGKDIAELFGHRSAHQPYELFSKLPNRICHICDKRNVNTMRLQFHYRSVHLNKHGGLCSVCRKTFRCYTAWRNHERLHKGSKYICDLCGNKFLFRHQIQTHLAEHSNVRRSICDICGKAFKRASYLKEHLNTVHTKEPVNCAHCDKTFKCPANLREHLKQINKAKNFKCEVCFKHFASPTLVRKHMFWHTGERPYSCEKCGAKYKAKSQLKIHMRKHTGQRPYPCEQCDKCFPTPMQLKRHRSVHTGDRPYKCTVCTRSFHYKKLLLMHCTSKHKHGHLKCETNSQ